MTEVKITGLTMITNGKPNLAGKTMLARFDCEVRGFILYGCAFARTAKNGFVANAPKYEAPDGRSRAVVVRDDSLRHAMMMAARGVYQAMGGEADWLKCEDMDRAEGVTTRSATAAT
jgi:hypothetical protein